MRLTSIVLTVAGTFAAGAGLALLLGGWIGLAPYPLAAGGALLIVSAILGMLGRK